MSTLPFLITFLLFFSFIHIGASGAPLYAQNACFFNSLPWIRFPFRLKNLQPSHCGYSESFDLSFNNHNETILTLPSSRDFIVKTIDYTNQNLWVTDLNSCFPRLFLDHGFSLKGSPFSYAKDLINFTLLNCSSSAETLYPPISCLSNNEQYVITAVLSSDSTVPPLCSVFSTTSVPLGGPLDWTVIDLLGVELAWDAPDCRFCVGLGKVCEFENAKSSKLMCFDMYESDSSNGISSASEIAGITCLGFLGLLFTTAIFLRLVRTRGRVQQPIVELSTITNQQPPAIRKGLDDSTIESYPKIQLGHSLELPNPNDNSCPICLGTYKFKETLRTIPECNHYFHANCIDQWLRTNATCPLCRNPSECNKVIIEA